METKRLNGLINFFIHELALIELSLIKLLFNSDPEYTFNSTVSIYIISPSFNNLFDVTFHTKVLNGNLFYAFWLFSINIQNVYVAILLPYHQNFIIMRLHAFHLFFHLNFVS